MARLPHGNCTALVRRTLLALSAALVVVAEDVDDAEATEDICRFMNSFNRDSQLNLILISILSILISQSLKVLCGIAWGQNACLLLICAFSMHNSQCNNRYASNFTTNV